MFGRSATKAQRSEQSQVNKLFRKVGSMSLTTIKPEVFERLKRSYRDNYGGSSGKLVEALDSKYQHKPGSNTGQHIISEKAIRLFFGSNELPRVRLQNLNYLCDLLLGVTYYSACEQINQSGLYGDQPMDSPLEQSELENWEEDWVTAYAVHLKERLGRLKILDMTQMVDVEKIYTEVVVTDTIRRRQFRTIRDLMSALEADLEGSEFKGLRRLTLSAPENRLKAFDAVKQNRKLMVYGKLGAGKSMLLKGLALYFPELEAEEELVPVYISLRDLVEDSHIPDLLDLISDEFSAFITEPAKRAQLLLEQSRCLILLDGLDEVSSQTVYQVCRNIDNFVRRYSGNRFVITCRTAAHDVNFNHFTEVEIADFNHQQVEKFSRSWFKDRSMPEIADIFLRKLNENPSIKELTTSPLLLTMLCWVFEDRYELSKNLHVLYTDVVDVLLRRWDASRRIDRKRYRPDKLSRQRKVDLFSEIAYNAFTNEPNPKIFWEEDELEEIIYQFIQKVPEVQPNTLDEDTKELLRAIQANTGILIEHAKGIYGFAHLTFQEYFTARHILYSGDLDLAKQAINKYLLNRNWREVFIIMAGRMKQGDDFLRHLFNRANEFLKDRSDLQSMLRWLHKTTATANVDSSSWRAYYFMVGLDTDLYMSRDTKIDRSNIRKLAVSLRNLNQQQGRIRARSPLALIQLSLAALHVLASDYAMGSSFSITEELVVKELGMIGDFSLDAKLQLIIDTAVRANYPELPDKLTDLRKRQPNKNAPSSQWEKWAKELQALMIEHLDVGYIRRFSDEDIQALEDYLHIANLILDCIQGDSYSSRELREQIVDNLLMPVELIPPNLLSPVHDCSFCH